MRGPPRLDRFRHNARAHTLHDPLDRQAARLQPLRPGGRLPEATGYN
ncbi:hypothetical protein ACI2S3_17605 [Ralstonia nicotianae]|nr:hypothetical protein [Ralstonia pseudosolanacearum]ANH34037.1 hypothetical protein A3768_2908 [Ralstonia solanacearum]ESS48561.1 hypothetical protein L665_02403 [Ralstonia solanacearum SD54]MCK4125724.1 hypothetical protein [Ralstonia pseudosolanacearum]MCK4148442.1 hypothetical protein [Ralstonia pseudosolanacearum]MCK4161286.1 hypothetical protein [Ralstonia pseudosolanacearum]